MFIVQFNPLKSNNEVGCTFSFKLYAKKICLFVTERSICFEQSASHLLKKLHQSIKLRMTSFLRQSSSNSSFVKINTIDFFYWTWSAQHFLFIFHSTSHFLRALTVHFLRLCCVLLSVIHYFDTLYFSVLKFFHS